MKHKFLYILASLALITTSCQKVIDINLTDAEKQYVIDGEVSTNPNIAAQVKISLSKTFSQDNSLDGVSGANVSIQEDNGSSFTLTEVSKGFYTNPSLIGKIGSEYKLNISVNGKNFSSSSTLPMFVALDSLSFDNFVFGGSINKTVRPSYKDPLGIVNFYKFTQYRNGKQIKFIWPFDDDLTDGRVVTRPFINPNGDLQAGDTIKMVMQSIDANSYRFWYSLMESASGNSQSAAPTNPITNISGGALGVFSATTYDEKTIILK